MTTRTISSMALVFFAGIFSGNSATFDVTSLDGDTSPGTYRWAVDQANGSDGPHTIDLTSLSGEIILAGSPAPLLKQVTILGPGADQLTIIAPSGEHVVQNAAGDKSTSVSDLTMRGPTLTGGLRSRGGAILTAGELTIRRCHFQNFHGLDGGAVYAGESLVADSCLFENNTADQRGGGVFVEDNATIRNCSFSGNKAGTRGGGLAVGFDDVVLVSSCTFTLNEAAEGGGGIDSPSRFTQVSNSIVAANTVGKIDLDSHQLGGPVSLSANNLIGGDPLLYPLRKYLAPIPYHLPKFGSPAIDGGTSSAEEVDARSAARPANGAKDLGAIEARYFEVTNNQSSGTNSLRDAIFTGNMGGPRLDLVHISLGASENPQTILLTSALPVIARGSMFSAAGDVCIDGGDSFRHCDISEIAVAGFDNMTFCNGKSQDEAGGSFLVKGRCFLERCVFRSNTARCAGAIRIQSIGSVEARACHFGLNTAKQLESSDSGAVEILGSGSSKFENCTFLQNRANNRGGAFGIFSSEASVRINHCTFMQNASNVPGTGAAIHHDSGSVSLLNSLFVDNGNEDGTDTHWASLSLPTFTELSNILNATDEHTKTVRDSQNRPRYFIPLPASGALDAADPFLSLPTDERGVLRPANGLPDAGAIEVHANLYERWAAENFLPEELCKPFSEFALTGPFADFDKDGLDNFSEYLYLRNPRESDAEGIFRFAVNYFPAVFNHYPCLDSDIRAEAIDVSPSLVDIVQEHSTDLQSWTPIPDPIVTPVSPGVVNLKNVSPHAVTERPRQFLRQRVEPAVPLVNPAFAGVSEPNNPDQGLLGIGAVGHHFSIAKFEITVKQWVQFLNAVDWDGDNTLGLWQAEQGIIRDVNLPLSHRYYHSIFNSDHPITHVDFYDACRFCNWLHNTGRAGYGTESGAYLLTGDTPVPSNAASISRADSARFAIPTIHEWYKAGHYQGNGIYSTYPQGQSFINNNPAPGDENTINYNGTGTLPVGSFPQAQSLRGAFDMGGNVAEWTETRSINNRHLAGGAWSDSTQQPVVDPTDASALPTTANGSIGIRIIRLRH